MLAPVRNIKRKIKAFICLLAFMIMLTAVFVSLSKTSNAAVTYTPLPDAPVVAPGPAPTFLIDTCIVPGTLTATIVGFGASTGAGITAAEGYIRAAIPTKAIPVKTAITVEINDHMKGLTDFFMQLWHEMLNTYFRKMTSNFAVLEANQERMLGSLIDAAEQNKAVRNIGKTEAEVNRAMRPSDSLKVVATIIGGLERAKSIQKGYTLASAEGLLNRTAANQYAKDIIGSGADVDFSGGFLSDFESRWKKYEEKYCDSTANAGHAGCTTDGLLKGLDINVSDAVFSRETIEFAAADIAAAVNELVINFSEPFIPDPLIAGLSSSVEGQEVILDTEAYKAKRQVVLDAINYVVSRRLPGSQMGKYMQNLRGDAGIKTESLSNLAPYNPSYNEIMHYMTSERFRTGKFATEQIDEPENNLREKVVQNAFFLMQLNDMNDLLDKQAMIITSRVSENVKQYVFTEDAALSSMSTGGSD